MWARTPPGEGRLTVRHDTAAELTDIPPIVLLVDDDRDTLAAYSAYFEASGMWVATTTQPGEALDAVQELKPDLIVTEVAFQGQPLGADLIHALKGNPATQDIPLIALSGGPPSDPVSDATRAEATVCLTKPVLPDTLLVTARRLLAHSHDLRERSDRALAKGAALIERSSRLTAKAAEISERMASGSRLCPECGQALDWIEQGRIGGVAYDYYRWCLKGCGLFCYDRDARRWVKLA
jgi:CheY-like chemotaxis protein